MNRSSSSYLAEAAIDARLAAICKAVDEINRLVSLRGKTGQEMATLGECDWLAELERLLYDE